MPAISFLVCTRNRADTVHECVLGLLASPRRDFEVVVRDNCSTDNTLEILNDIKDDRLKIHSAPENQGTFTFWEASKLASGEIVTWLSDEDSFQFQHLDYVLNQFRINSECNVMFGGIIVGNSRKVEFPELIIRNVVKAHMVALSFSGCGGLFVKRNALPAAHALNVRSMEEAYVLWNYYPVGIFASRCLTQNLMMTSRVVVVQTQFAKTTNNWSQVSESNVISREPHYYPDSVFDRLNSNIVNVFFKKMTFFDKLKISVLLIKNFIFATRLFNQPEFIILLRENYSELTVAAYLKNFKGHKLDNFIGQLHFIIKKLIFTLPFSLYRTSKEWSRLFGTGPKK